MGILRTVMKGFNPITDKSEDLFSSYNALKTIETEHFLIHNGLLYAHEHIHTEGIAAGARLNHIIRTTGDDIHLRNYSFNGDHTPCGVYLYKSPFTDADSLGAQHTWHNKNWNYPNSFTAELYSQPFIDVNSLGVLKAASVIQDATAKPGKSSPGVNAEYQEWVIPSSSTALITLINSSTSTMDLIEANIIAYIPR